MEIISFWEMLTMRFGLWPGHAMVPELSVVFDGRCCMMGVKKRVSGQAARVLLSGITTKSLPTHTF